MTLQRFIGVSLIAASALIAQPALAQTTAGSGTVVVLPLAANIPGAYTTTVFVRNPNAAQILLKVRYYQSINANPAGNGTAYPCNNLLVSGSMSVTFDLASQCTFAGSDNFGFIVLEDITGTYKTNRFYAYSRTQQSNGNGFSVEGFPIGNFSGAPSDSLGLRKTSVAPHYKSNCFVGALGEAVNYQIVLRQGETGAPIGNPITGQLQPFEFTRILDVFAGAGAGAASYSNVRANFVNNADSAMIAFCTMETSDNGSADFRVAKSEEADDNRQSRLTCYGMDSCGANVVSVSSPGRLSGAARNVHYLIINQPDYVKCDLISPSLGSLQIKLRGPGSPTGTGQFALPAGYNAAPYTSGGASATSLYVYTGEKGTIASGTTTRWYIDVSTRTGAPPASPLTYGIKCTSGNGLTVPWLGTSTTAG